MLATLARSGVYSERLELNGAVSRYPAHATLVTGRGSDSHGIASDQLLSEQGVRSTPYWHASRLKGGSLWQAEAEAGGRVVALDWPTTVGASIDTLLPDLVPLRRGESWLTIIRQGTSPWLMKRIEPRMPPSGRSDWPTLDERDGLLVDLACDTTRLEPTPSLWLLRLSAPGDAVWRNGPGTGASRKAFARADARLRRLLGCFADSGLLDAISVVVVGGQAWQAVHTRIEPNVALQAAGLVARDPRVATGVRSWKAIARSNGGSAFVYAKDEASALLARDILREEAQKTKAFRVVSASEMASVGADPEAWFGLEANPGFSFGNRAQGSELLTASPFRGAGGYLENTARTPAGMVGWGAGLRRAVRVPVMPAVDIAPTLAALLEVALPGATGKPFVGILSFDPGQYRRHRPERKP